MALQPTVALRQVGKGVFCAKYKKAVFLTLFYNCALQRLGRTQRKEYKFSTIYAVSRVRHLLKGDFDSDARRRNGRHPEGPPGVD